MEFTNNKPIYIQIADNLSERILKGEFAEGSRIPSVREWGAGIGVNPNTVARSYELLTNMNVISNQRGIGYFVENGAREVILERQRKEFLETELPYFLEKAKLLGVDLKALSQSE